MAEGWQSRAYSFFDRYKEKTGHNPPEPEPSIVRKWDRMAERDTIREAEESRKTVGVKPCPLCGRKVGNSVAMYERTPGDWMASIECPCGLSYDRSVAEDGYTAARACFIRLWNRREGRK